MERTILVDFEDLDYLTEEMFEDFLETTKEYVKEAYKGYLIVGKIDFSKYIYENNIDMSKYYFYEYNNDTLLKILLSKEVFSSKEEADIVFDKLLNEYLEACEEVYGRMVVRCRKGNTIIKTIYSPVPFSSYYKLDNYCEYEEEYKTEFDIVKAFATEKYNTLIIDLPDGDIDETLLEEAEQVLQTLYKDKELDGELDEVLDKRRETHGEFSNVAEVSRSFKEVLHKYYIKDKLSNEQIEALEMILHKIARILSGNPNEKDHWIDIAGYASLISKSKK